MFLATGIWPVSVCHTFIIDEQDFGLESLEGMREITDEGDLHLVT